MKATSTHRVGCPQSAPRATPVLTTTANASRPGEPGDLAGSRVWKAWPETAVDITRDRLRILKDREGLAKGTVIPLDSIRRTSAGQQSSDRDGVPPAGFEPATPGLGVRRSIP